MMGKEFILVLCCAINLASCVNRSPKTDSQVIHIDSIVDLTHTLTPEFPFIPVKNLTYPFELIPMATLKDNGVAANSWKIHEHLGTHIDAPNHFVENQKSVDQIALKDLIVPVVVIDINKKVLNNSDAELTVDDIKSFESKVWENTGSFLRNDVLRLGKTFKRFFIRWTGQ